MELSLDIENLGDLQNRWSKHFQKLINDTNVLEGKLDTKEAIGQTLRDEAHSLREVLAQLKTVTSIEQAGMFCE